MSLQDLINKSKTLSNKNKIDTQNNNITEQTQKFKLNIPSTNKKHKTTTPDSKSDSILSDNSISNILGGMSNKKAETNKKQTEQNTDKTSCNTIEDLSKFVFKEQPDESTQEIAFKFSEMLNTLSTAVGSDIPDVLANTLKFMKEHAFLAKTLKPVEIGELVATMARSYNYVANNQINKTTKKQTRVKEQNDILNSLEALQF